MLQDTPLSDLWWATPEQAREFRYLYFGHHGPISDGDDPFRTRWFHSLDVDNPETRIVYPSDSLGRWRQQWQNTNVYRSLVLLNEEKEGVVGPFLVDIDSSEYDEQASAYREDLEKAQTVARLVASFLRDRWRVAESDVRVFFSGRKGFNFEVRPRALGVSGDLDNQLRVCERLQAELRNALGPEEHARDVDRVFGPRLFWLPPRHPFVRLHESINAWKSEGAEHSRRRIELTLNNLMTLQVEDIVSEAEG